MSSNFKLYSEYYDLLYHDKDYDKEANYIVETIKKHNSKAQSIIEFGSGTGKHGVSIQNAGFEVAGVELSIDMAEIARRKGLNCVQGNIIDCKLDRKYDVAISLFHVISYLTDNISLVRALENVHNHLKDDGLFIFDAWYSPAVNYFKPEPRIKRISNKEIEVVRFAEPEILVNDNVVNVHYKVLIKNLVNNAWNDFDEVHPMRHFTIPEIGLLAKLSGFEFIAAEEFLTADLPSEKTWGVCFIFKKVK